MQSVDDKKFYDTYTGLELDPVAVKEARREEIRFGENLDAWKPCPIDESIREMGRPPYGTRWLDYNKGDDENVEMRSRLVVQETKRQSTIAMDDIASTTASTPPLEIVRLFCSLCMSLQLPGGAVCVMQFLDISRAYPHCPALRKIYVRAPDEVGLPPGMCWRMKKSWYGTRDAGQVYEFAVRDDFIANQFDQGRFSVCVYRHKTRALMYFVFGDDYVGIGCREDLEWYRSQLSLKFTVKNR